MLQTLIDHPEYWNWILLGGCVLGAAGGWFVTGMLTKYGKKPNFD